MKTFAFNFTFTRPDENDAIVYEVGYNCYGTSIDTVEAAEEQLRRRNAHLTIIDVKLFAVMNEDGDVIVAQEAL